MSFQHNSGHRNQHGWTVLYLKVGVLISIKNLFKVQPLPEKAGLFIHNAPSHPWEEELQAGNIFIKHLPPIITTVLLQPMDQFMIEAIKLPYKKKD